MAENAAAEPALDFEQRLDQAHDRVYAWTQGVVEATDHRFAAQDRELQPVPAAPFRDIFRHPYWTFLHRSVGKGKQEHPYFV